MKEFCRICFISIMLCLFLTLPANIDAQLQNRDFEVIRIAFMNGCIRTFEEVQDEKQFQILKKDRAELKRFVQFKASEYMEELHALNKRH